MDSFNEELLVPKEWLVKVDAQTSTPYLIKFHSSPVDLTCCIMITDTKRTWVEALSSKQFARRWRECNNRIDSPPLDEDEEEAWRTRLLDLLSSAHTLGGMLELSFEVVESKFADFAFQFECNAFKWRWDTVSVGHKISAEILSKHLIMPLISVNHLAFSSPDAVGDLPPTDLEKAVDKVARTARRTVDTHVKNALSKARLATTIRRITAVFNFISEPPNIVTDANTPALVPPPEPTPKINKPPPSEHLKRTRTLTPEANDRRDASTSTKPKKDTISLSRKGSPISHAADSGSATEPEDDPSMPSVQLPRPESGATGADQQPDIHMQSATPSPSRDASPRSHPGSARSRSRNAIEATKAPAPAPAAPSDTDSSPARPVKKSKPRARSPSSDEDSEEERKMLAAQIRRGAVSASGVRQPIKRGGKRF